MSDELVIPVMKKSEIACAPPEEEAPNVECRNGHIYFQSDVTNKSIDKLIQLSEKHIKNNLFGYSKPDYYLHINSYGGEIYETLRFLDFLDSTVVRNCSNVISIVEGVAMSAASLMAVSFPIRYITNRSTVMIHEMQGESGWGTFTHLEKRMNWLKKLEDTILDIYVKNTKVSKEEMKQMMLTEEYMDADKAYTLGLVDKILK